MPKNIFSSKNATVQEKAEHDHYFYQGMLVEIGNKRGLTTSVPSQDRNRNYMEKKLREIITVQDELYCFSYDFLVDKAKTVDVTWFNKRKMPDSFFEIEHTTDIQNSLLKYMELRDFNANFFIIADILRKREFEAKLSLSAFEPIFHKVRFASYRDVSNWHAKTFELLVMEEIFNRRNN